MDYLFWGFLLVFLDINIHFGVSTVDFLPSWLGYLLMIKGLDTLAEESERFAAARPWCVGMAVYTGVLWIADLFALGAELTFFTWLLGLAGTCVSFYITSIILDGIDRMQAVNRLGEDARAGRLARAARPREEIGVRGAPLLHLPAEGIGDVALADDLGKGFGPPLAVQRLVHGQSPLSLSACL